MNNAVLQLAKALPWLLLTGLLLQKYSAQVESYAGERDVHAELEDEGSWGLELSRRGHEMTLHAFISPHTQQQGGNMPPASS